MGRRNNLDVYADILSATIVKRRKTDIVHHANLNFNMLKKYMRKLMEHGFIQQVDRRSFVTTGDGLRFLEEYRKLVPIKNIVKEEF